jgi:hypothetical protein
MEDLSEMKPKLDESSAINMSGTPRASLIDSTSDLFGSRNKSTSFISPKRHVNTGSFITAHTRSGSSFVSPPNKSSFILEGKSKEFSLKRLDEKLNKISEDLNTDRNTVRDTAIETFREKLPELLRDARSLTTDRSTLARQLDEDFEFNTVPTLRWCAFCAKETSTEIEFRNSSKTFWASMGIFFMGGVFGCFLIPYVTNRCKDMKRVCHLCKRDVA